MSEELFIIDQQVKHNTQAQGKGVQEQQLYYMSKYNPSLTNNLLNDHDKSQHNKGLDSTRTW